MKSRVTYGKIFLASITGPWLRLQNEHSPWTKISKDALKKSFHSRIPEIQMDPLGDTETQDDIKLGLHCQQELIIGQHIVFL